MSRRIDFIDAYNAPMFLVHELYRICFTREQAREEEEKNKAAEEEKSRLEEQRRQQGRRPTPQSQNQPQPPARPVSPMRLDSRELEDMMEEFT